MNFTIVGEKMDTKGSSIQDNLIRKSFNNYCLYKESRHLFFSTKHDFLYKNYSFRQIVKSRLICNKKNLDVILFVRSFSGFIFALRLRRYTSCDS